MAAHGPAAESSLRTPGPRAAERWLVEALEADAAACAGDLRALARPLSVVVHSRSLRLHVAERLMAGRGRAALGVQVTTLHGLAAGILARFGLPVPEVGLAPLLVRRAARAEPALAQGLESLDDGYQAVAAAVDDLLDAGFEPPHADVLHERVEEALPPGSEAARRALALLRVAGQVAQQLDAGAGGHRSRLYRLARELLERDPEVALAARGVWIHGFADATGVQADLIEALVRHTGARVLLDAPPEPGRTGAGAAPRRFGRALVERVEALGPVEDVALAVPAPAAAVLLRAPARGPEVRAVAVRVRAALDAGVAPERIAIVARDLAPYRSALRRHLSRLGIPFSGVGERGAATAARRRLAALERLLEAGAAAPVEVWLDGLERIHAADGKRKPLAPVRRAELHHALHARGVLRLAQVAELPEPGDQALDARLGLRIGEKGLLHAARRTLPAPALAAAVRSASTLVRRLATRPGLAPASDHGAWLLALVDALGWLPSRPAAAPDEATPGCDALREALGRLGAPADFPIDDEEFLLLLRRALRGAGFAPFGGAGGGVQVLSVTEARARGFEQLFVLGLSRGVFPRSIAEDPLLPDVLRARLREVLPDLPVKRDGFDEERFLFAQLLAAADRVVLSHPEKDDAGRPLPRSPLLEPMLRAGLVEEAHAPALHAASNASGPATPGELALLAGLHGSRAHTERALRSVLAAPLAAARAAVVRELEARRDPLGPYFGFVGAAASEDPRQGPRFVTTLESVARCPWQAFLKKLLGLAPVPDGLGALPGAADSLLLGSTVHDVLERIAGDGQKAPSIDALRDRAPRRPPWPDGEALEALLLETARGVLHRAGVAMPGYEHLLALHARPCLEAVRQLDWAQGPPPVLGVEVRGEARVVTPRGERSVHFRADRVDLVEAAEMDGRDGAGGSGASRAASHLPRLRLTDYKTGSSKVGGRKPETRFEKLRGLIEKGALLQAAAYARAAGKGGEGRYLYVAPDIPEAERAVCVGDEGALARAFDGTVATLLAAWEHGSFAPRLREGDDDSEPWACQGCEVKEACLRGDSGARHRLGLFLDAAPEEAPPRALEEQAAWDVLHLGSDAS